MAGKVGRHIIEYDLQENRVPVQQIKSEQLLWEDVDGLLTATVLPMGYKLCYVKRTEENKE